jgi:hypothetical protein
MDANADKANFASKMMTRLEPQNRVTRVTEFKPGAHGQRLSAKRRVSSPSGTEARFGVVAECTLEPRRYHPGQRLRSHPGRALDVTRYAARAAYQPGLAGE